MPIKVKKGGAYVDAQLFVKKGGVYAAAQLFAKAAGAYALASAATVTPALAASRVSGPAPLAVMFDAMGTTSTAVADTFRQVLYTFDFGDPSSGTYSLTDGASKNVEAGGPLAWHVFETPGTYTVTVVTNDGTSSSQKTMAITVQDPNVVYAGASTICVDPAGSTGWGPAGATYATAIPATSTWNNTRIMLKRGADFSAAGQLLVMQAANWQVVAGGTGAPPIVDSIAIGTDRPPADFSIWPDNCVIADLACSNGFRLGGMGSHHLALRCSVSSSVYETDMGWSTYYMFGDQYQQLPIASWQVPKFHLCADCSFPGSKDSQGYNLFVPADSGLGVIGCHLGASMYHNMRITQAYKFALAHNQMDGDCYSGTYHCLKVHGGDLTEYAEPLAASEQLWASRYGVVQHNIFGSAACPYAWLTAFCPENDTSAEGVEDVLVLNNTFIRSQTGQIDVAPGGKRISMIGNVTTGGTWNFSPGHEAALPVEWRGPYYTSRT